MTDGMRVLLESIVTSNREAIRVLERQTKNINGLLYVDADVGSECCTDAGAGLHLQGCIYYHNYHKGD